MSFFGSLGVLFQRFCHIGLRELRTNSLGPRLSLQSSGHIRRISDNKMSSVLPHQDSFLQSHYDPAVKNLIKALQLAKSTGAAPEVVEAIQESITLSHQRDQFAADGTTQESETCTKIKNETLTHDWDKVHEDKKTTWRLGSRMMSGHLEGQFLKSFLSAQKAKKILDVGMFTGYSALSIAEALPADGKIVSLDMDQYLKDLVESLIQPSPHKNKVEIIIGQALDSMKKFQASGERFDAIFLDADKSEYEEYLKLCLEGGMLAPGGTVLVDNAFLHGSGYMKSDSVSAKFHSLLRNKPELHVVLVPMRDGVYLIRRRCDVDGGVV